PAKLGVATAPWALLMSMPGIEVAIADEPPFAAAWRASFRASCAGAPIQMTTGIKTPTARPRKIANSFSPARESSSGLVARYGCAPAGADIGLSSFVAVLRR